MLMLGPARIKLMQQNGRFLWDFGMRHKVEFKCRGRVGSLYRSTLGASNVLVQVCCTHTCIQHAYLHLDDNTWAVSSSHMHTHTHTHRGVDSQAYTLHHFVFFAVTCACVLTQTHTDSAAAPSHSGICTYDTPSQCSLCSAHTIQQTVQGMCYARDAQ